MQNILIMFFPLPHSSQILPISLPTQVFSLTSLELTKQP